MTATAPTPDPDAVERDALALDVVLDEAERRARQESGTCTGEHCAGCEAGRRVGRARAEVKRLRSPHLAPGQSEAEVRADEREKAITPDARAHWEWAERNRQRHGDRGCICAICGLMANLTAAEEASDE